MRIPDTCDSRAPQASQIATVTCRLLRLKIDTTRTLTEEILLEWFPCNGLYQRDRFFQIAVIELTCQAPCCCQ